MSTRHSSHRRSHAIARALEEQVRSGQIRCGDRLPSEQGLCRQFGVSRTVVREALQSLKGRGVVVSRRGSGNFIGELGGAQLRESLALYSAVQGDDAKAFVELLDLRLLIECECAARAAQMRTKPALAEIQRQLKSMEASREELARFGEADIAFHQAIVKASGHDLFIHILGALLPELGIRFARQTYRSFRQVTKNLRDHRAIYRAIADSDPVAAESYMRQHLVESREHLIAAMQDNAFISRQPSPTQEPLSARPARGPSSGRRRSGLI